jgi:hypothetical protein
MEQVLIQFMSFLKAEEEIDIHIWQICDVRKNQDENSDIVIRVILGIQR